MFGLFANSRFALALRKVKGRFGISAPRVAVKTHLPWHWRVLSVILLFAVLLFLAVWVYDAGQRLAGFHQSASEKELASLRERMAQLEAELDSSRKVANASESRLQIESTAQKQLSVQIKALEEENSSLKADLAMFENLAGGDSESAGISISRLHVSPVGSGGQYRYRLLLTQASDKKGKEFNGTIQFLATVRLGNETVMMMFPKDADRDRASYQVSFRHFRRLEGVLKLAEGSEIKQVEARLLQDGAVKATQLVVIQ